MDRERTRELAELLVAQREVELRRQLRIEPLAILEGGAGHDVVADLERLAAALECFVSGGGRLPCRAAHRYNQHQQGGADRTICREPTHVRRVCRSRTSHNADEVRPA